MMTDEDPGKAAFEWDAQEDLMNEALYNDIVIYKVDNDYILEY